MLLECAYPCTNIEYLCFSAFEFLLECVDIVIKQNCDEDAAQLYDELVKAQVPSEVSNMCHESGPQSPTMAMTDINNRSTKLATVISLIFVCLSFVCFYH